MKNSILVFITLFVLAVSSRWLSHMWNFTLLGGVFLFAGAYFKDKKIAALLMLSTMLVSDMVIGFHNQMLTVYLSFLLIVGLGTWLQVQAPRLKVLGFSLVGSFLFFAITNFAVWFEGQLYPPTLAGLMESYMAGLPFYRNQMISDVISSLALFEVARHVLVQSEQKHHKLAHKAASFKD